MLGGKFYDGIEQVSTGRREPMCWFRVAVEKDRVDDAIKDCVEANASRLGCDFDKIEEGELAGGFMVSTKLSRHKFTRDLIPVLTGRIEKLFAMNLMVEAAEVIIVLKRKSQQKDGENSAEKKSSPREPSRQPEVSF